MHVASSQTAQKTATRPVPTPTPITRSAAALLVPVPDGEPQVNDKKLGRSVSVGLAPSRLPRLSIENGQFVAENVRP